MSGSINQTPLEGNMKKGFTLVEIMIVVAIIGIIIAIAVPAFIRARENSRGRACQENLTKLDGAKEQYALEKHVPGTGAPTSADLVSADGKGTGYLKVFPTCPGGGTYGINDIDSAPTCDYTAPSWATKHSLADLQN